MNITRSLTTLVTSIGEELANINERNRKAYYNQVVYQREQQARMDVGEVEKEKFSKLEPPMQVVMTNPDALVTFLSDKLNGLTKAAENWNEREEGIENMAGIKAFRLDPENPNAGPYGVAQRSVMSGNVASWGTPAAEPADSQSGQSRLSDAARNKMAEQDAEKQKEAAQRHADKVGTAVAEPVSGTTVHPKNPNHKEDPVTRRGNR